MRQKRWLKRDKPASEDEGWEIRKDGAQFWANVIMATIRDSGGQSLEFAQIIRDLSGA